jgi:lysophospholipase L1-like esterase
MASTIYYYRVRAYKGTNYSDYCDSVNEATYNYFTITATGTGAALGVIRMTFNANSTLYTTGAVRFCDSGGNNETTSFSFTANVDSGSYVKLTTGTGKILYRERAVSKLGVITNNQFWTSSTNAPVLAGSMSNAIGLKQVRIQSNTTLVLNITNSTLLESITHWANPATITGNLSGCTKLITLTLGGTNTLTGSLTNLTDLVSITCDGNSTLSGSITNLKKLVILFVGGANTLSGNVEGLTSLAYLRILYGTNTITGSIAGLTSLWYCQVQGNNTLSYPNVTNLKALCYLNIWYAILSESNINQLLADCWLNRAETKGSTDRVFNLSGGNANNAPTGQGLTDKANLIAAGWTVTTRTSPSAMIFGTSITYGLYASPAANRYSTVYCAADSLVEYNYGVNGKKLMQDPTTPTGTSMYETMALIPTKPNHARYLIFEFGANDYTYFPTYDDDFIADYEAIIDNAISKGWAVANIKLLTPYLNCSGFDFTVLKAAIDAIGTSKGVQVIDTATDLYNGGNYAGFMTECVHPNNTGYARMAAYIDANIVAP